MAELEIDQSNLPRVQEVCQCFAVLEDGALAHNLQEQEIEHYYTNNIQKNQLVQNDIRMAKRLQDEEQEEQAQQSALLRQTSRQLEEQDFEYARVIQEEIQRCAEEAQRREQDDEELAKQMQEEEEERIRRRSREHEGFSEGSTSGPALPSPHQHTLSSLQGEGQHSSSTTRWQCSTSLACSDLTGPQAESPRGVAAQKNTTPWSNEGHTDSIRHVRDELREPLSEDSEDSDAVFSEQLSAWSQRLYKRVNAEPPRRWASLYQPKERNYRGPHSHSSFRGELRSWEEESGEWPEDNYEYGDPDERREGKTDEERIPRDEQEHLHRNRHDPDLRSAEVRERRRSRSECVGLQDGNRHSSRDLARTWTCRENPDKHVRFQEDTRSCNGSQDHSRQVWEMLGQVLRERGIPVRFGVPGVPLQVGPLSRDSQVHHGSEVSYSDSQPHQRAFQRAALSRHSFHGDIRESRRLSYGQNSERDHGVDRHCDFPSTVRDDGEICEMQRRDSHLAEGERRGSRRWRGHKYIKDEARGANPDNNHHSRATRTTTQHWHKRPEERFSSEEEEVERRVVQPRRRFPQRSQSLRGPTRHRLRPTPAGAPQQPKPEGACLDMGELQQVLQDEEMARRLQEEEEKLSRRSFSSQSSQPPSRSCCPDGDFRVAQVAQDEEIARFMQKQEIKTKRRSRELEGPASWREHRAMISQHDRRAARERQLPQVQRERLDSEGLPSPTEDCSPENLPPSPISTLPQAQQIRNIAEELDPTFQGRRQGTESLRGGQTGPARQSPPLPNSGVRDLLEEPAFIPPTKRQTDKSGRTKPKEKKENCKQQ